MGILDSQVAQKFVGTASENLLILLDKRIMCELLGWWASDCCWWGRHGLSSRHSDSFLRWEQLQLKCYYRSRQSLKSIQIPNRDNGRSNLSTYWIWFLYFLNFFHVIIVEEMGELSFKVCALDIVELVPLDYTRCSLMFTCKTCFKKY